jgi:Tol biopolymer transport system component
MLKKTIFFVTLLIIIGLIWGCVVNSSSNKIYLLENSPDSCSSVWWVDNDHIVTGSKTNLTLLSLNSTDKPKILFSVPSEKDILLTPIGYDSIKQELIISQFYSYKKGEKKIEETTLWKINILHPGKPELFTAGNQYYGASINPQLDKICFSKGTGISNSIYIYDLKSTQTTTIMTTDFFDVQSDWSPDGSWLVLVAADNKNSQLELYCLYRYDLKSGKAERIETGKYEKWNKDPSISKDAKTIVFTNIKDNYPLIATNLQNEQTKVLSAPQDYAIYHPKYSPDGNKMAYILHSRYSNTRQKVAILYLK